MSDLPKPNQTQLAAAQAVLQDFARKTHGVAAENLQRSAIYAIYACLTDRPHATGEYRDVVMAATDGEIKITDPITKTDEGIIVGPNNYGIPEGEYIRWDGDEQDFGSDEDDDDPKDEKPEEPEQPTDETTEQKAETAESLDALTKEELHEKFGVSTAQNKPDMIAEILAAQETVNVSKNGG